MAPSTIQAMMLMQRTSVPSLVNAPVGTSGTLAGPGAADDYASRVSRCNRLKATRDWACPIAALSPARA